eukprot:7509188-Pyramimonas_sp.AAC.1
MTDACESGSGIASARFAADKVADVGRISERWRYRGKHPLSQPRRTALGKKDVFSDRGAVLPEGLGGALEMLEEN